MRRHHLAAIGLAGALALAAWASPAAQNLLTPLRDSGQTVTPVFEGWYRNVARGLAAEWP